MVIDTFFAAHLATGSTRTDIASCRWDMKCHAKEMLSPESLSSMSQLPLPFRNQGTTDGNFLERLPALKTERKMLQL